MLIRCASSRGLDPRKMAWLVASGGGNDHARGVGSSLAFLGYAAYGSECEPTNERGQCAIV